MKKGANDTNETTAEQLYFLQMIMDSIGTPIFYKDRFGRYQGCNKAFEEYTGKKSHEIIGQTLHVMRSQFESQESIEAYYAEEMELIENGGKITYERTVIDSDGIKCAFLFTKSAYRNREGNVAGIVGVATDITARKNSEQAERQQKELLEKVVEQRTAELQQQNEKLKALADALKASEEKYAKAFRRCAEVIGIIQLKDRTFVEVNETFTRILGYSPNEVIGKTATELCLWEDIEEDRISYEKLLQTGTLLNVERALLTKNGERRIGVCSCEIIELSGESCVLFTWHDITLRKQAEEELKKSKQELEYKVTERTKELTEKIKELSQTQQALILQEKMAAIGQLAAGVAHEMNNPLGFVTSNFQSLERYVANWQKIINACNEMKNSCSGNSDANNKSCELERLLVECDIEFELQDIIDICSESKEGLRRVNEIIRALRSFSRTTSDEQFSDYDLNEGIRTTLLIARNEIKYAAEVVTNLEEVSTVSAIGGQINQVLLNILVNAAHAIKSAQLATKGVISIHSYPVDQWVVCDILNNGPPIPEEIQKRIFEPFFTTKPVGEGTGIGLSLSYDIIVNRHKGRLSFASSAAEGTRFRIELPTTQTMISQNGAITKCSNQGGDGI